MSTEQLLALAVAFANATGNTERAHALADRATNDDERAQHTAKAQRFQVDATRRQDELRRALRTITDGTVRAVPDGRLPVSTWQRRRVEVRAITTDGTRTVRVNYTPAEALAAGTALIACAALTDTAEGGTLSRILGTFPSASAPEPEPVTVRETPENGTRA